MSKRRTAKEARRKKKFKKRWDLYRYAERSYVPGEPEEEFVKVRVQSTPKEIDCFHRLLNKCEELGMCEVINFSDMFHNKGTNKYYRAYSDVVIKEGEDNE